MIDWIPLLVIENLKHSEMLDPLDQAWQTGSALAAYIPGRVAVNKYCTCGSLLLLMATDISP